VSARASILVSGLSYQAGLTASTAAASASAVCSAYTALQGHRALKALGLGFRVEGF